MKQSLFDILPWYVERRWMYHVEKAMTSTTITFCLYMFGVPLLWASGIGIGGPVIIPHIIYAITKKYTFNIKDTLFDLLCSGLTFPFVLYSLYGWQYGSLALAVVTLLYTVMYKLEWNSP
jgi:hypothetical protein